MTAVSKTLRDLLRDRFQPPEWVMAFEVQAESDEGGLRFADAIAIRTQKGRVEVHGFEIKVSRADWLQEIQNPSKALAARSLCDYWWIVAGGPGIVKLEELPFRAGLMVAPPGQDRLAVVVPAIVPILLGEGGAILPRELRLERALVAAVLRRLDPMEPRAYWESREHRAEAKGYARGRNAKMVMERKRSRKDATPEEWPTP